MDLKPIEKLQPFRHFCMSIGELPSSYMESMTYVELLMWLCKYLSETVIPTINNNAQAVEELQTLYVELKNYVDNYFDNLDVQDEINNKLDEMVESGEFQNILANITLNGKIIFGKNFDNYTKTGDFCIIQTPNKNVLIDCEQASMWTHLVECFNKYNITHFDTVILTHFHADHTGNFQNLCVAGYIDSNTKIYAQAFNEGWMYENNQQEIQYNNFINCVNTYNLDYNTPTAENETIDVDYMLSIRFNNVDPSYWLTHYNGNNQKDYNDTSYFLSITYGKIKFLTAGDAGKMPFIKMVEDGYIDNSYNLFKIEHHGINNTANAVPFEIMNIINPDYAVQTSSLYEVIDTIDNEASSKFKDILDFKCFVTGYNEDYICFNVSNDSITIENGNSMTTSFGNNINHDIYIDNSSISDIQDGTQNHPFTDIPQAFANLNPNFNGTINIHIADGTYSNRYNTSNNKTVTKICGYKGIINIIGNTSDNTKVILENGFIIKNSNVNISNLTINNNSTNRCIDCYSSTLEFNKCIFKSKQETTTSNCIFLTSCLANINECDFSYYASALSNYYSIVTITNNIFNNVNNIMYNKASLIKYNNNTSNPLSKLCISDYQSNQNFIDGLTLYSDATGSDVVTLPEYIDLSVFKTFEITVTDGTVYKTITLSRSNTLSTISFNFLDNAGSFLYEKGCYFSRNGTTFSLLRKYQKRTLISNNTVTWLNDSASFKITNIKAY